MRARPTLTNPRRFTALSQLSHSTVRKEGLTYHRYRADGRGGDVYVSIPQVINGGLTIYNVRNAVVVGCHLKQPRASGPRYGGENVDGYEITRFTGTVHIEGCYVDQGFAKSDCLCWNYAGPNSVVVVQNCRFQNPIEVLYNGSVLSGHGDLIHAQGGGSVCSALYVENFSGWTSGQGFQLPTPRTFAGAGIRYLSIKNAIITRKGAVDSGGDWKSFNIGTPEGAGRYGDSSPANGGEFEDFYLDTVYTPYNYNDTVYSMITFNSDSRIRQTAAGWVYFAGDFDISGYIKPGNIDNFDPVPASKVGLNYDRSWFEDPGDDPGDTAEDWSISATLGAEYSLNAEILLPGDSVIPTEWAVENIWLAESQDYSYWKQSGTAFMGSQNPWGWYSGNYSTGDFFYSAAETLDGRFRVRTVTGPLSVGEGVAKGSPAVTVGRHKGEVTDVDPFSGGMWSGDMAEFLVSVDGGARLTGEWADGSYAKAINVWGFDSDTPGTDWESYTGRVLDIQIRYLTTNDYPPFGGGSDQHMGLITGVGNHDFNYYRVDGDSDWNDAPRCAVVLVDEGHTVSNVDLKAIIDWVVADTEDRFGTSLPNGVFITGVQFWLEPYSGYIDTSTRDIVVTVDGDTSSGGETEEDHAISSSFGVEYSLSAAITTESEIVIGDEDDDVPDVEDVEEEPITDEVIANYFDVTTYRDAQTEAELVSTFREHARPSSIDWFTLIDSLVPKDYDSFVTQLDGLEGAVVKSALGTFSVVTPTTLGRAFFSLSSSEFIGLVSSDRYNDFVQNTVDVSVGTGLVGGGTMGSPLTLELADKFDSDQQTSTIYNRFYTDANGFVTDTTAATTATGFYKKTVFSTSGSFDILPLVDSLDISDCSRIEFTVGPLKAANDGGWISVAVGTSAGDATSFDYAPVCSTYGGAPVHVSARTASSFPMVAQPHNNTVYLQGSLSRLPTQAGLMYQYSGTCYEDGGVPSKSAGSVLTDATIAYIGIHASVIATSASACVNVVGHKGGTLEYTPSSTGDAREYTRNFFSWIMMSQPIYGDTSDDYAQEIALAADMNLTGFAVEIFNNSINMYRTRELIEAANNYAGEFYLYPVFNQPVSWDAADIRQLIREFNVAPSAFKISGKLVVGTYRGDQADSTWWNENVFSPLSSEGISIYFVPYFYDQNPDSYVNYSLVDGATDFAVTYVTANQTDAQAYYDSSNFGVSKPYHYGFSPAYWQMPCDIDRLSRYYEKKAGEGIASNFDFIINNDPNNSQAAWGLLTTWNDFGENSFWASVTAPPSFFRNEDVEVFTHRGFARLAKHYVDHYRAGTPKIDKEFVTLSYRPHPIDASAPATDEIDEWGRTFQNFGGEDSIFVTTVLNNQSTVRLVTSDGTTEATAPAGVSHISVSAASGVPYVEVERNSNVFLQLTGAVTIVAEPSITRNFNIYSDYSEGLE